MAIDLSLDLALNLRSLPGGYALLLGSGISRNAGIPTGWDVVLDLINQLSTLLNDKMDSPPEEWYKNKFGEEADYSKILDRLAGTQPERMNLIKKYFEPNEEDIQAGLKVPTKAHRAIAKLVRKGYIRIIVTTNFDRLLEKALEDEAITPDIIASEDDFKGVLPYIHSKCIIIKIHGDYRDTRIKNTIDELDAYSSEANQYLDRIFDEFGLIVCGWSASWDIALRNAILRCPNRRFSTFWLSKGVTSEDADKIIQRRVAKKIEINGADQFFIELVEKVESLEELENKAPLSVDIAVATVKRYLVAAQHRIRLHDLIYEEIEAVWQKIESTPIPQYSGGGISDFQKQIKKYDAIAEKLIKMLAVIAYHGDEEHQYLIFRAIERLGTRPVEAGLTWFIYLKKYIALLIIYSTGLSGLAKGKYKFINSMLSKVQIHDSDSRKLTPVLLSLHVFKVFTNDSVKSVQPNVQDRYTPVSDYLYDEMKSVLSYILPGENEFMRLFDYFEFLLAITFLDLSDEGYLLPGCYEWRDRYTKFTEKQFRKDVGNDLNKGIESELLKAGFFNGDIKRFKETLDTADKVLTQSSWTRI